MKNATIDNKPRFKSEELLNWRQIAGYFSRKASKVRQQLLPTITEEEYDEIDEENDYRWEPLYPDETEELEQIVKKADIFAKEATEEMEQEPSCSYSSIVYRKRERN